MTGTTAGPAAISEQDLPRVPVEKAVYLQGPAGSVTVHHCRMIPRLQAQRPPGALASAAAQRLLVRRRAAGDGLQLPLDA